MSTQKIISGNSFKNNNSTVAFGGNVQTGFTAVSPTVIATDNGPAGVLGPSTLNTVGVSGLIAGGNYAKMVAGAFVGKGYSTNLCGGTATKLAIAGVPAGAEAQTLCPTSGTMTTDFVEWSYVSGVVTSSSTSQTWWGEDFEATITRSVPGRLTFMETGATPTNDTYDAKTQG